MANSIDNALFQNFLLSTMLPEWQTPATTGWLLPQFPPAAMTYWAVMKEDETKIEALAKKLAEWMKLPNAAHTPDESVFMYVMRMLQEADKLRQHPAWRFFQRPEPEPLAREPVRFNNSPAGSRWPSTRRR